MRAADCGACRSAVTTHWPGAHLVLAVGGPALGSKTSVPQEKPCTSGSSAAAEPWRPDCSRSARFRPTPAGSAPSAAGRGRCCADSSLPWLDGGSLPVPTQPGSERVLLLNGKHTSAYLVPMLKSAVKLRSSSREGHAQCSDSSQNSLHTSSVVSTGVVHCTDSRKAISPEFHRWLRHLSLAAIVLDRDWHVSEPKEDEKQSPAGMSVPHTNFFLSSGTS